MRHPKDRFLHCRRGGRKHRHKCTRASEVGFGHVIGGLYLVRWTRRSRDQIRRVNNASGMSYSVSSVACRIRAPHGPVNKKPAKVAR